MSLLCALARSMGMGRFTTPIGGVPMEQGCCALAKPEQSKKPNYRTTRVMYHNSVMHGHDGSNIHATNPRIV